LTALLELHAVKERADGRSVIANSGSRNLAATFEKLAGGAGLTVGAVVPAIRLKFAKAATEQPQCRRTGHACYTRKKKNQLSLSKILASNDRELRYYFYSIEDMRHVRAIEKPFPFGFIVTK
jgi:hypothetical protein